LKLQTMQPLWPPLIQSLLRGALIASGFSLQITTQSLKVPRLKRIGPSPRRHVSRRRPMSRSQRSSHHHRRVLLAVPTQTTLTRAAARAVMRKKLPIRINKSQLNRLVNQFKLKKASLCSKLQSSLTTIPLTCLLTPLSCKSSRSDRLRATKS